MSPSTAERAITISALIVGATYIYRRLTEGQGANQPGTAGVKQLAGQGSPPGTARFITAYGFTFLVISMMAAASPGLGGAFAMLVTAGDLLGNATQVAADVNQQLATAPAPQGATVAQTLATDRQLGLGTVAPKFKQPQYVGAADVPMRHA